MTLPRPPWDFHSQDDEQEFKTWLNQQLDASYEPTADDIWREAQNDDAFHVAMAREYGQQLQRGRVILAARQLQRGSMSRAERNRALQALQQLMANDQELTTLALQELTRHRERGRKPGDPRPRDLTDVQRTACWDALAELDRIRQIIEHHWHRYKGSDVIAIEVAAARAGISPDVLVSFRKNRPRHSAS